MNAQSQADFVLPIEYSFPAARDHAPRHGAIVFGVALAYATVRYHLFKGVPWADWPIYTINKAFAVTSLGMLALAIVRLRKAATSPSGHFRVAGSCMLIHALLSAVLLNEVYLEKFFAGARLTPSAGLAVTAGAVAFALFHAAGRQSGRSAPVQALRAAGIVALLSGVHATLPGWTSWFSPAQWPGLMPPITLLAATIASASWVATLCMARSKHPRGFVEG